jgi:hypothetical protein
MTRLVRSVSVEDNPSSRFAATSHSNASKSCPPAVTQLLATLEQYRPQARNGSFDRKRKDDDNGSTVDIQPLRHLATRLTQSQEGANYRKAATNILECLRQLPSQLKAIYAPEIGAASADFNAAWAESLWPKDPICEISPEDATRELLRL